MLLMIILSTALTLKVSQSVCMAPCDARVIVRVEPEDANRNLKVEVDGPMATSTERQLDGKESRITWEFWFKHLTVGEYEIRAILERQGDKPKVERTTLIVKGDEP